MSSGAVSDDEGQGGIGLLNMQDDDDADEEVDSASQMAPCDGSVCDVIMDDSNATSNSMMAASLSPGTVSTSRAASNGTTVLTQAMITPICSNNFVMGESSNISILPTTESFPCEIMSVPPYSRGNVMPNIVYSLLSSLELDCITIPPRTNANVAQPVRKIAKQVSPPLKPTVTSSRGGVATTAAPTTTMLQLILRLPDGSSVPVNIPSLPAVTSAATVPVQQVAPPIVSGVQDVHSKNTASFAKLKLKQTLTNSQGISNNGPAMKLYNECQVLKASDCLNLDSASNDSDSHSFSSKRQRLEDDDEEKRKKFLERNRAAATRCQQKRKQWVQTLEGKAEEFYKETDLSVQETPILLDGSCLTLPTMGDDKPFACNAPGCEMRFTNEDHLTVHLNTPAILASDLENESHHQHLHITNLSESDNSNGNPVELLSQRREGEGAELAAPLPHRQRTIWPGPPIDLCARFSDHHMRENRWEDWECF